MNMRHVWRLFRYGTPFFVILAVAHGNARAGGFLDLYGGAAMNRPADTGVSETMASGTAAASSSIDLSASAEFGARFGAWYPAHNWIGLGMDLGYFQADGSGVNIDALPFSLLLALRAPLYATTGRPAGRLQPYVMAGVSFYMIDISVQLDGMGGDSFQLDWPLPGSSGDKVLGPYLAAGLAWQPASKFAFFGEYRYSTFDVGYDTTNSMIVPTMNGRVDTSVNTDHILFGFSYRFGGE